MPDTPNTLTNIDFGEFKQSLKNYLRNQPQFQDYNFEGSNMAVLLDVLAYNTLHNQFFLNMAISEMFLDTAQMRDSILSHAKELGYNPRSAVSAVAYVNIEIEPNDAPTSIVIPKGTRFTSRIDSDVFTFVTAEAQTIFPANGEYIAANTPIYEGQYVSESFVVDTSVDGQRFVLANQNIDTNSLEVLVYENINSDTYDEFMRSDNLLGLSASSKVFFTQPAEKGKLEILFGDDIVGAALAHQNLVRVSYRICNGEAPNGCSTFTPVQSIDGYSAIFVTTVAGATGGAEPESIESIRRYAPRNYRSQYRAVNASDYETLLTTRFPEIEAISVYGGEDADPPQFGKVLISVDIGGGAGIPDIKKTAIEEFIASRAAVSIRPQVIDPEFLYIEVVSDVDYRPSRTTFSQADLRTKVLQAITAYRDANLNDFGITFNLSKLIAAIDAADVSFTGNNTRIRATAYMVPDLNEAWNTTVSFQNALQRDVLDSTRFAYYLPAIQSSQFTYNGRAAQIEDDGEGTLQIVSKTATQRSVLANSVGSVDYATGKVIVTGLNVSAYTGEAIKLHARLLEPEIRVTGNKILDLSLADVAVTVNPVL